MSRGKQRWKRKERFNTKHRNYKCQHWARKIDFQLSSTYLTVWFMPLSNYYFISHQSSIKSIKGPPVQKKYARIAWLVFSQFTFLMSVTYFRCSCWSKVILFFWMSASKQSILVQFLGRKRWTRDARGCWHQGGGKSLNWQLTFQCLINF